MKKPDRDSRDPRDSRDSVDSGMFRIKREDQLLSKQMEQGMHIKKEDDIAESPSATATNQTKSYWEDRYPAFPPVYPESPFKRLNSTDRCSIDSETGVSPCPSPYLMSYQVQEKIESELASLYAKTASQGLLAGSADALGANTA